MELIMELTVPGFSFLGEAHITNLEKHSKCIENLQLIWKGKKKHLKGGVAESGMNPLCCYHFPKKFKKNVLQGERESQA